MCNICKDEEVEEAELNTIEFKQCCATGDKYGGDSPEHQSIKEAIMRKWQGQHVLED